MKGFDPKTSFGYEASRDYDAVDTRGDEDATVSSLAGLASGAEALEFAVGTGRIALPLWAAGVRVDGIERSPHMIDRMREKPGGDQVAVTMGDMSQVTTGRTYGLVYLVYNTIGNLLTQDDQVRCFENAARHLTDDGVFVLECRVPTAPARPAHRFIDVERLEVDHVGLDVCRYDPVSQILDVNHVHIGADGLAFSRSGFAWRIRPSSTSWRASPGFGCATGGEGGTANRTLPPVGATSACTSGLTPEQETTIPASTRTPTARRPGPGRDTVQSRPPTWRWTNVGAGWAVPPALRSIIPVGPLRRPPGRRGAPR